MQAEQRRIAGERARRCLRIPGGEPGKAGEGPGARPLGKRPQAGEEQCPAKPARRRETNEQRTAQCREQREYSTEKDRGHARKPYRHAAENAEADIDPRNAGQEQAAAIGSGDQGGTARTPGAGGFGREQAEQAAEAQPVDRKPAKRGKGEDAGRAEQQRAEAVPAQRVTQDGQPRVAA